MLGIKDVRIGSSVQVDKIYCGTDVVYQKTPDDITPPITSPRPYDAINNPTNTYDAPQTVYFDANEMCDTYFTTDGTTPTTASTHYVGDGILVDVTKTIKYFSVDQSGNTETVKELTYTINIVEEPPPDSPPAFPRYVRFIGYGDQASASTTRLVEFQVFYGATNLLLNKVPISGEPISTGASVNVATDGIVNMGSGTYPIWWSGQGIPTLTYDLLDWYDISQVKVWMFSTVGDPRQTKFKIDISADNVAWFNIIDHSLNTTVQPDGTGWVFTV
jgi:Chitobiase/beta-hexosaminidase C-terminal domain